MRFSGHKMRPKRLMRGECSVTEGPWRTACDRTGDSAGSSDAVHWGSRGEFHAAYRCVRLRLLFDVGAWLRQKRGKQPWQQKREQPIDCAEHSLLQRISHSGNTDYPSKVISIVLPLYPVYGINQEESTDYSRARLARRWVSVCNHWGMWVKVFSPSDRSID